MKDYWQYFGCSKGCPNDTKPVHSHHDTEGCEIVCAHCGALYTYSYEEMQDYYFAPLCNFDEGVACEWDQFYRHFEAIQKFAKDKERTRIIAIIENRICFDHNNGCDHGACHALADLAGLIKGEQK